MTASSLFVHNMLLYSFLFFPIFSCSPRSWKKKKRKKTTDLFVERGGACQILLAVLCFSFQCSHYCTLASNRKYVLLLQHFYEHVEYTSHFFLQYNTNINHVSVPLVTELLSCLQRDNNGIMIIINTLRDSHLMRHHHICLTKITKNKCRNYLFIHCI